MAQAPPALPAGERGGGQRPQWRLPQLTPTRGSPLPPLAKLADNLEKELQLVPSLVPSLQAYLEKELKLLPSLQTYLDKELKSVPSLQAYLEKE